MALLRGTPRHSKNTPPPLDRQKWQQWNITYVEWKKAGSWSTAKLPRLLLVFKASKIARVHTGSME